MPEITSENAENMFSEMEKDPAIAALKKLLDDDPNDKNISHSELFRVDQMKSWSDSYKRDVAERKGKEEYLYRRSIYAKLDKAQKNFKESFIGRIT